MIDKKKIEGNFQQWMELMDLGFEMALAGIRHQSPGKDPLEVYKKRWRRWQQEHLNSSIRYLEVISRAAENKQDSA